MPHGNAAGAAEVPPATATAALSSEPLATWTRSDDKLLEMLIVRYFTLQWDFIASRLMGDKTPEQTYRRYEHTVQEVTHALQALHVETPREWDMPMAVPASSRAVVVPVAAAADAVTSAGEEVAAAEEIARVPPSSAADSGTSEPRSMKKRKRGGERKKPEKWTELEHRRFLECLEKCGEGNWKMMSSQHLTTKSASQIASHHQKFRIRQELRKRNGCKRASIHDITEPTTSADGAGPAAQEDEPPEAPPGEQAESVEEFPDQYDLGTLFM